MTLFYHCVANWLFQDHLTQFYDCVPYWLLSRPFDLILLKWTQLTPFKTIWPNFILVYPIDSFQDHLTQFYHCVPNWLLCKIRSNGLERSQLGTQYKNQAIWYWKESIWYRMQKSGNMVLEGVNWVDWVHNVKIRGYVLERSQLGTQCLNQDIWSWTDSVGYTLIKSVQMKLERSNLSTQCKNQVRWSWKEWIWYTIQVSGHMVLKRVNWVHNDKVRADSLERSQLGTQYKNQVIWSWKE